MSEHKECPSCCVTWEGEEIFNSFMASGNYQTVGAAEEAAEMYGWTRENGKCFKINMHSVQYAYNHPEHYDGVSEYVCDVCGSRLGRWSDKLLQPDECERRWGV